MLVGKRHFLFNKYVVSPFASERYYLSYCFKYKALWFRVAKVATRSIDAYFRKHCTDEEYVYSSRVGYLPSMYKDFYKFAFVRHPVDRFLSAWRDKVCDRNYFEFSESERERMMDFSNFVAWVEELDIEKCDEHICAQHVLIDMENIDMIGHLETLNEDMYKLATQLGMPTEELTKENQSKPRTTEVDDELRTRIEGIYKKDLELFYSS